MATMDASSKYLDKEAIVREELTIVVTYLNQEVAHVSAPEPLTRGTLVPGIARKPRSVEAVLFKTAEAMADTLHQLGGLWLADLYGPQLSDTWLGTLIQDSAILRYWDLDTLWVALPTERKSTLELVMPGKRGAFAKPLLNCKSAVIADLVGEITGSTIDLCPNALAHLMGECQLGHESCAKGLGSATAKP
jgi:hypothetical protein